jgi:type I restriction enzyme, R subunit
MTVVDESVIEDAALEWFAQLGYERAYGPNLAPGEPNSERDSFEQVYLYGRLRGAARRINPGVDADLIDEAIKRLERAESQSLVDENARVHKLLTEGVPVEYRAGDGSVRTTSVWLIDFDNPTNNDWLVVNQYTIVEAGKNRRPDVLVF